MKTIILKKQHGNHEPKNAKLKFYAEFETYEEAEEELNKLILARVDDDSEVSYVDQAQYWAIYEEGDDEYVDSIFF